MTETTLAIDGMMCGMCEAHLNDAIRRNFAVKRVKSKHRKGTCAISSEQELDMERVRAVVESLGYRLVSYEVS